MTRSVSLVLILVVALGLFVAPGHTQEANNVVNPFTIVTIGNRFPLDAVANYTRASGEYLNLRMRAARDREKLYEEIYQRHEKQIKHNWTMYLYHLEMTEKLRDRQIEKEVEHSQKYASVAEIVSGNVLNYLLKDLQKESISPENSQKIDPKWLKNINFMSTTGGNTFFLRTKKIPWTAVLQEDVFNDTRELIEQDLENARNEIKDDKVPGKTLKNLIVYKERLYDNINRINRSPDRVWSERHIIEATRQVYQLAQTLKLLESPEEAKRLLAPLPQNVSTVADLVRHMRENAMTFSAAATSGTMDYVSLHAAFVTEHREVSKRRNGGK